MSFTSTQTGIENYAGTAQLLFPHPPIVEERFAESSVATVVAWSIPNTACLVQYQGAQTRKFLKLLVRTLTAADMTTLTQLRDAGGLMYAKITPGTSTTILCAFAPDEDQEWEPMVADHPEKTATGTDIPALLKVYEAHIVLVRME
jgi:hypothetical protein